MIDRLLLALELTAHILEPFAILAACGLFAVAIKTFHGIATDLRKDSRPEHGGCKPRPRIDRPGGRQRSRSSAEAPTSQRGSTTVTVQLVIAGLCFIAATYLWFGPIAALVLAGLGFFLSAAHAIGADEDGDQ